MSCDNLIPFADGELSPDDAELFRSHIATCVRCQHELLGAMKLRAAVEAIVKDDDLTSGEVRRQLKEALK